MHKVLDPLGDRVVVKLDEAKEKIGSIIVPDTAKDKTFTGKVIAAGPGDGDKPMNVKVGDSVIFGKYSGNEIEFEGDKLLLIRQGDIGARVINGE